MFNFLKSADFGLIVSAACSIVVGLIAFLEWLT